MRNYPSPSPSEIVMKAILELKQVRGTSLADIVKFARSKYGLSGDALRNRVSAALKRGIKHKILYLQRGLYHVNRDLCQIPTESENSDQKRTCQNSGKDPVRVRTRKSVKCIGSKGEGLNVSSQGSMKKRRDQKKKKKKKTMIRRNSYLCPECRESIKAEVKGSVKGEDEKSQRYELRPRTNPSRNSDKASNASASQSPKEEEKKGEGKISWKDYLRMKISLTSRRRSKDKK